MYFADNLSGARVQLESFSWDPADPATITVLNLGFT